MIDRRILSELKAIHNQKDSLIIKAPGRINIIGEHTDYNNGFCLPAAIDLAVFMGVSPNDSIRIHSMDRNDEWDGTNAIRPDWAVYFSGALRFARENNFSIKPFRLDFGASLPSGAGLSSSSAITCGFLFALNQMNAWNIPIEKLTRIAVKAERESGLEGGMMDQISIFNGAKDHALLIDCQSWSFEKIPMLIPNYQWTIVDTKVKHKLVDSEYNDRSRMCNQIAKKCATHFGIEENLRIVYEQYSNHLFDFLDPLERVLVRYIFEENDRVRDMKSAIINQDTTSIGKLLYDGHEGLKSKYKVTCEELDFLVQFSQNSYASIGARMMGGGFGGSTLHLVKEENFDAFSFGISAAYKQKFGFDPDVFKAQISNGIEIVV